MRTTKIMATLGPASRSSEILDRMFDHGIDVVRINMSHGTHAEHTEVLQVLRRITEARGVHVARVADLCGPKVRTGVIDPAAGDIARGATCRIMREEVDGTASRFGTNYPGLVEEVAVGHRILIDDGLIRLRVTEKLGGELICGCEVGGTIGSRKGINVPDSRLSLSSMTDKDQVDLKWIVANEFDFVALSFVRGPEDVERLRATLDHAGSRMPIISKIETPQAIESLDRIIEVSDAILVARGDLGVEMDVSRIPMLQKDMVRRCRTAGKPVIVATQMLHSMVSHPVPTRAEVSDVANAVFDGADAVMLSAESAAGRYPIESVAMMNRICSDAHEHSEPRGSRRSDLLDERLRVGQAVDRITSGVVRSTVLVAQDLGAKLVAVWCRSGRTAQWISKYRVRPLVGLSADPQICRRMALSYGVEPLLVPAALAEGRSPWSELEGLLVERYGLQRGDLIVVVGDPTAPQRASTLTIHAVGSE